MAGGMSTGQGRPLGERRRIDGAGAPQGAPVADGPPAPSTLAKHAWVVDAPGHRGRWPGRLVEWRRSEQPGWEARVVFAVSASDGSGTQLVERWLPMTTLLPAL